MYIYSENQTML